MKILFVYPNSGSQVGFNYGVACMAAVLRQRGHQVEFWQLCEDIEPLPDQQLFTRRLRGSAPDLIGFSVVTNQWALARRYAAWCRAALPATPVVCGGVHATLGVEDVLADGTFDYAMVGECDEAFADFADALAGGSPVDDLPNLARRDRHGAIRVNPVRPLPSLGELPPKDYSIFDFQKIIDAKNGWVGLMASRGCPYSCTYCFNHLMVRKYRDDLNCSFKQLGYIRHHSVAQMIAEIRFLEANYQNISTYIFDDDLFTFDAGFVDAFCAEYRKTSKLPFVVNGHVGLWDDRRAEALAKANCRIVKFGLESGSPRIRSRIMNRHMSNAAIATALETVRRHGMHSSCFVMIGLPHETADDLWQTIDLLAASLPGRYRWTFFYPFPGTESHRIAAEGGFINEERFRTLQNFTDASCLDFGGEQDLLLKKIGAALPWFVNARSHLPVAEFYRQQTDRILAMSADEWNQECPTLPEKDREFSRRFSREGKSHYAIKYNRFMGVISDYFLAE